MSVRSTIILIIISAGLVSCYPREIEIVSDGSITDARDSQIYHYITIGTQNWLLENMNYAGKDSSGSWCYKDLASNCATYGRLYTWDAALKACPQGWHLPSDKEWKELEIFLGMPASEADSTIWRETEAVGIQIKATWDWNSGGTGENTSRFTALPAGFREPDGQYQFIGDICNFWTSSYSSESHAWGRALIYYSPGVYRWKYEKEEAYSVRCVMN